MSESKKLKLAMPTQKFEVVLPASKSISNRALILNALSYSDYPIENLSDCDDTNVTVRALESNTNSFDIGAAGTAMRFLTAFLAKTYGEWVITGSERMQQRPIKLLVDALNSLGARIEYINNEGFPPLRIFGCALTGGEINLNGSVSSQYISALMMIAPYMHKGLSIKLEGNVISVPYILMTKQMMEDFGAKVKFENNTIHVEAHPYTAVPYRVESDWSAASYWYELVSMAGVGEISLPYLNKQSMQGDSKVAELYTQLGVATLFDEHGITIKATGKYTECFEYNFTEQPDLAQTFAVNCCLKNIPFSFSGLESLKIKETNRVLALMNELRKLGYVLHEPCEGALAWNGERTTAASPIEIATYEDHRMAMAFAPVALLQEITILEPQVVSKSYPGFWTDLKLLMKA